MSFFVVASIVSSLDVHWATRPAGIPRVQGAATLRTQRRVVHRAKRNRAAAIRERPLGVVRALHLHAFRLRELGHPTNPASRIVRFQRNGRTCDSARSAILRNGRTWLLAVATCVKRSASEITRSATGRRSNEYRVSGAE